MLTGSLILTNDVNFANTTLFAGGKVLLLSEEPITNLNQSNSIVPATILLPPYPSVMAELDGNIEEAFNQYNGYLATKEPSMFICAVITALLRGINIVILAGKNESEMKFISWLQQFMSYTYGIVIQTPSVPFMYNNAYDGVILTDLYGFDLIGYNEFLIRYPYELNLPRHLIPKLVIEINPYIENPNEENYIKYFEIYKNRIKENNNQLLINPLLRG